MSFPFDPANADNVRQLLSSLGAAPNKTLGQNFLVDEDALNRICDVARLSSDDFVLEIGPGLGALTVRLLARAQRVVAIEKDAKFATFLKNKLPGDRFQLVAGDALDVPWDDLNLPETGVKIVANLPYSISKPILRRFLEPWRPHLQSATLLLQREVANRLIAAPDTSEYGPMSIMAQLYCVSTKQFDIAPDSFLPPPAVTSTVIHLEMLQTPTIDIPNEKQFWATVRAAFGQRRKTLNNTLKPLAPRERLDAALERAQIDPKRRGETLSVQEFANLSAAIFVDAPC
jgi:16S rRNA (adenine1518-N6/adenine1519-N6)-dimethyltransferase